MRLRKRLNLLSRLAEARPEYFDYLRGRLDKDLNNAQISDEDDGSEEAQREEAERAAHIEQRRQEWIERRRIKAGTEVPTVEQDSLYNRKEGYKSKKR